MQLRHYTTRDRVKPIMTKGLDPEMSRGAQKCIWLVTELGSWRLVRHLEALRGVPTEGWAVITVDVPDHWLVAAPTPERFKCFVPIPAWRLHHYRKEAPDKPSRRKVGDRGRCPSLRRKGTKAPGE